MPFWQQTKPDAFSLGHTRKTDSQLLIDSITLSNHGDNRITNLYSASVINLYFQSKSKIRPLPPPPPAPRKIQTNKHTKKNFNLEKKKTPTKKRTKNNKQISCLNVKSTTTASIVTTTTTATITNNTIQHQQYKNVQHNGNNQVPTNASKIDKD